MPSWWGKSASKEIKKKTSKGSIFDSLQRKFRTASEDKSFNRSGGSLRHGRNTVSERASRSRVPSRSQSPSIKVSRCHSFAERPHAQAQPLPLPGFHVSRVKCPNSRSNASIKPEFNIGTKPSLFLPLPASECLENRLGPAVVEGDVAFASISGDSSTDTDDPSNLRLFSPLVSNYGNGNITVMNSPLSGMPKDHSPTINQKHSMTLERANLPLNKQNPSTSPKRGFLRKNMHNLQIPQRGAFCSAPDSSTTSPSRSPLMIYGLNQVMNSGLWIGKDYSDACFFGSGHCSSAGSGHNSGHNSVGRDMSGQLFWQPRCSPESPIPSPGMTSPGPSSRINSGTVTPLHLRAGGAARESSTSRSDVGQQQSHRLPLPPVKISISCPLSPTYSITSTPVSRSPGRTENLVSPPGSRWKKGRLLGRGTFGHVYLGFNRDTGEMCAMKEVTLFVDGAKSTESVEQLGQEISLLSRLRHPNIVQYLGSEILDDKLYIYLEYVSGGSIYKLLQDYGQFGEIAIRSYTQQILSGLAYLHAKNTLHRDIKGANILVDPNGRVKLADFGMAKHITGEACPLSFKGSPYWMAPEVIKNSNGCNLSVDIWSLGCTVLEMATAKPPWSQYEGVAALFKIGNSKELPVIPNHLSDDGKDFVRLCLQRNPSYRPTAAQLMEHPFVRNSPPLERHILCDEPAEPPRTISTAGPQKATKTSCVDSERVAIHQSRTSKTALGISSDTHIRRNISCPVSPVGSPLLHSRSSQHTPSPISSPHTRSGSSTPITGGSISHVKHPMAHLHKDGHLNQRVQNNARVNTFGQPEHVNQRELYNGQVILPDRVCQKLL